MTRKISIEVVTCDIRDLYCDVVLLKYARQFYGADAVIAGALKGRIPPRAMKPEVDGFSLVGTKGQLRAKHALFVGTERLESFSLDTIRSLSRRWMSILASKVPHAERVGVTIHGVSRGLGESDSVAAFLSGVRDAAACSDVPISLRRIVVAEEQPHRASRLKSCVDDVIAGEGPLLVTPYSSAKVRKEAVRPRAFVAMPFAPGEMDAVYDFGIRAILENAGFDCERSDRSAFSGEILKRVRQAIERSDLVIAEVTGVNPNVCVEVGYAWGWDRPTLLVAKQGEELPFDLQGNKCLYYSGVAELGRKLTFELANFLRGRV